MVKMDAVRQSPQNILSNAKQSRVAFDKMWNAASRAPMFCKISKSSIRGLNKRSYRTARLVSDHAYKIAASGAVATAARVFDDECKTLSIEPKAENARAPWLPGISKGARILIEQFLCAVAQEATLKAHAVREGSGSTKRLNGKQMRIGWEAVFETVFSDNNSLVPRAMHVASIKPKRRSNNKKGDTQKEVGADEDDDYDAPRSEDGGGGYDE